VKFTIKATIPFPLERVYSTQRDKMVELAPYLNDIKEIKVLETSTEGSITKFVNEWHAAGRDIPAIARAFVKPEMLKWLDYATWDASRHTCDWRIELGFLAEAITARGHNEWRDRGNETLVVIDGEIVVNARKIPGVPGLMAGQVGSTVEQFVVKMIEPNLKKTCEGVTRFLRENPA